MQLFYINYWEESGWKLKDQRAKKVVSDSPGLVDFATGLVNSAFNLPQGSQIRQIWHILRQNCSDDSTEVTEGVTSTPEIFANKQGATSTPEICGNKHSFVLTFFTSNTIHVNCKRCKP